jgi:hypothetical protein
MSFLLTCVGYFEVTKQEENDPDHNNLKTGWYESVDGTMRHVFIARDKTEAGRASNDKTFQLIRSWIRFVPALPLSCCYLFTF